MTAITEHWESMARPVVHSESLRCLEAHPTQLHYWEVTEDNRIECLNCGYSESLRNGEV